MWQITKLLGILLLALNSEAIPKRYHGLKNRSRNPLESEILLSNDVTPVSYEVDLTVTDEYLNSGNFSGRVDIVISVAKNVSSFKIHAKDITINGDIEIKLLKVENAPSQKVKKTEEEGDSLSLSLQTGKEIEKGMYQLTIPEYSGILSDTAMEGFYRSKYTDEGGNIQYLAATQFEQFGARRAFPCFDQPDKKAQFTISITHSKNYNTALSNTALSKTENVTDGLVKDTFEKTPLMSTYLVAFILSKFDCESGASTTGALPVTTQVCGRPKTTDTMTIALETAPKVLDTMEEYTKISFGAMEVGKMTQVAIPDFAAGAMENWGLLTYREADLLWDENESSNYYRQAVVTVVAHELSHQWFGDYVTLDSWADIFLNEGFATYFEYYAADNVEETWELTKQFVVEQIQKVLVTDSVNDSLPLHFESNDPDEIESRFDDIGYNKGGSILRMVQHFLGLENFKKGLTTYLQKGRTGTPDLLWTSFNNLFEDDDPQKPPAAIEEIMDSWTNKAGYPVLNVALTDNGTLTISQQRFLLSGTDDTQWYVPITYTSSNAIDDFKDTTTKAWLVPGDNLTISLNSTDWIILNNQQVGYYRVRYEDNLFKKISDAIKSENFGNIDEISRSQLVHDQMNFARANPDQYGTLLDFLTFLNKETSYYTWYAAFDGFNYLLQRITSDSVKSPLKAYIQKQMAALTTAFPIDKENATNQIYTLNQVQALTWACNLGDTTCINYAKEKFSTYRQNETAKVSPNMRSIVYCNALRNSDKPSEDFDFLYGIYNETKLSTEQVTILKSLGCVNDAAVRQKYLEKALTDEVRLQDARYVFSSVYSSSLQGIDDVISFIKNNYTNFEAHFGTKSTLTSLISTVANLFTTQTQIDELSKWGESIDDESIKAATTAAVERANENLKTMESLETTLKKYFGDNNNNSAVINSYQLINLAVILIISLMLNYY